MQTFADVLKSLHETVSRQIPSTDYQQQIDRWNMYMAKLDEIESACNQLVYRGTSKTVQIAFLKRNVRREQTNKTIAFEVKPEVIVHRDAYLMQNMKNYQEQYTEPRIKLPNLDIFISIKWLERESLKLVMEQLSKIRLSDPTRLDTI